MITLLLKRRRINRWPKIVSSTEHAKGINMSESQHVIELGTQTITLPTGEQLEMVVLKEVCTGNIFTVEASYVEQEAGDVHSPYGGKALEFVDQPERNQVKLMTAMSV